MDETELNAIESEITEELNGHIGLLLSEYTTLADMQPPTSIVYYAARAAAQVIMAFERGYQLCGGPDIDEAATDAVLQAITQSAPQG